MTRPVHAAAIAETRYKPEQNRSLVFLRHSNKSSLQQMPANAYQANPLTQILQPQINYTSPYQTDKLQIRDIPGSQVDVHRSLKYIQGRDYIGVADVTGA